MALEETLLLLLLHSIFPDANCEGMDLGAKLSVIGAKHKFCTNPCMELWHPLRGCRKTSNAESNSRLKQSVQKENLPTNIIDINESLISNKTLKHTYQKKVCRGMYTDLLTFLV